MRTIITRGFSSKGGVLGVVQFLGVHDGVLGRVPMDDWTSHPRNESLMPVVQRLVVSGE
jgi:hypothetical protein